MTEYKVTSASSMWSTNTLQQRATDLINEHIREGWNLHQTSFGFSPWLVPTMFITFEREKAGL